MVSLKSSTETQVASQVLTQSLSANTVIPGQWGCDPWRSAYTRIVFSKYTVGLWYLWVPHLWIEATTGCRLRYPLLVESTDADPRIQRDDCGT